MHPDLDRLIRLQNVETSAEEARRRIAEHPSRMQVLDQRLEAARETVAAIKQRLAAGQERRRAGEKDLATALARLARYRGSAAGGENEPRISGDAPRDRGRAVGGPRPRRPDSRTMLEADELTAAIRQGEEELKSVEREAAVEREVISRELTALQAHLDRSAASRTSLAAAISPAVLSIFEQTARSRKGVAVAEARDGLCTICHVRLRPQVFNEIMRNDSIIQCDSCRRILYHVGAEQPARSDP